MPTIHRFEELLCWQKARLLDNKIYTLTRKPPFKHDFALVDQISRASGSVMDNVAEGFERDGTKEFVNFLSIAKGSVGEVRSQCYRANDRGYIDDITFSQLYNLSLDIGRRIGNLMTYLRSTDLKGNKYKAEEPSAPYLNLTQQPQPTDLPGWNITIEHLTSPAEGNETIETP